jgi:hypothetical protein
MMSAGLFVAVLKCSGNVFGGFSSFAWQRGTLKLIAIHLTTLHNILEYIHIDEYHYECTFFPFYKTLKAQILNNLNK